MGFGTASISRLVHQTRYSDYTTNLLTSTLLANTPQLILSLLYFAYNALFTCELVEQEWNDFGRYKKPLRVSLPKGEQKSTYWLNVHYKFGIPFIAAAFFLHWLISRAIFLVNIRFETPTPDFPPEFSMNIVHLAQAGWSPIAVIISIIAAALVLLVGLLFGLRRYPPGPPLSGCCSLIIAAACHAEPEELPGLSERRLQWGVTSYHDGIGHCTFSSRDVAEPNTRDVYAGFKERNRDDLKETCQVRNVKYG